MSRPEDDYPFLRNARSAVVRIGTLAAIAADARHGTVTVPGGSLSGVALADQITASHVGRLVCVLLDRDAAVAVCVIK